jgi:Relaxase/Mobilisation nuclease domain
MIGTVGTGRSIYHCISYCLEDKQELSEEQKLKLSILEGVQHKNRAEVLEYNFCYGDKHELTDQFKDVRQLNKKAERPVMHLSLRVAPGDHLTRNQLIELGQAAVKEFRLDKNQYVCILHKDTQQQHIHVVANRVGYDGKLASDSQSYRRMALLCRQLEKQYELKRVLSPRRFLSQSERLIPREDTRKESLKEDIQESLRESQDYEQFERLMIERGYQVMKARGISFTDEKKVKVKGSEVGFSLQTIEQILEAKQALKLKQTLKKQLIQRHRPVYKQQQILRPQQQDNRLSKELAKERGISMGRNLSRNSLKILELIMKPEEIYGQEPYELSQNAYRQRQRPRHGH